MRSSLAGDGLCGLRKSPFHVVEFSESVRPNEHGSEEPGLCELPFWNLSRMSVCFQESKGGQLVTTKSHWRPREIIVQQKDTMGKYEQIVKTHKLSK